MEFRFSTLSGALHFAEAKGKLEPLAALNVIQEGKDRFIIRQASKWLPNLKKGESIVATFQNGQEKTNKLKTA
jgi:hypothetical protein